MKNIKNDCRSLQMFNAIKTSDITKISHLIEKGYCLNLVVDGTTPLAEAAHRGNIEIIDLLINSGANTNLTSEAAITPLCAAVAANKLHVVKYLLSRGCKLNLPDGRPRDIVVTPLQFTILNDSPKIAEVLLENGHDPNVASRNCAIPLIEAIKYNRPATVKQLLALSHCKVETKRNIFGRLNPSALHRALFTFRRYEIAEILLKSKRVRLEFDGHSFISWMLCRIFDTSYLHKRIACMLLEAGGDMVYLDRHGYRPFRTVVYGNSRIFTIHQSQPILEVLIEAGIPASMDDIHPFYGYVKSQDDLAFCEWLTEVACKPRSLREQCRSLIRNHFGIFPNDQIKQLGLPIPLEKYLTLEVYRDWWSSNKI